MKKIVLGVVFLGMFSLSFGAELIQKSTDSSGNPTYHIKCDNGDYKIITQMGNTYSGSGGIFNSLSKTVSASCN